MCATREFNHKQNQKEVLSNTANTTIVIYGVSHLDMDGVYTRVLACRLFVFPKMQQWLPKTKIYLHIC